jgi:hypothetical protein
VFPELNAPLHFWVYIRKPLRYNDRMINIGVEISRTLYKTFYMLDNLVPKLNILFGHNFSDGERPDHSGQLAVA